MFLRTGSHTQAFFLADGWLRVVVLALIILLVGCQSNDQSIVEEEPTLKRKVESVDADAAQLPRVIYLVRQGHLEAAAALLESIQPRITPDQMSAYLFCAARLALVQQNTEELEAILGRLKHEYWSAFSFVEKRVYYALEVSRLESTKQPSALIRARVQQARYLRTRLEQEQNVRQIWRELTEATEEELKPLQQWVAEEPELAGWLALRQAYTTRAATPSARRGLYSQWKERYPKHAAQRLTLHSPLPPGWMDRSLPSHLWMPKSLGLLVPLSGPAAPWGKALKAGFEFASSSEGRAIYRDLRAQQRLKQGSIQLELPKPGRVSLHIYDVAQLGQLKEGLLAAQRDGVEFLVGPLLKEQVKYVQQHPPSLPVLSLNQPQSSQKRKGTSEMYFYGLTASDEAADTAHFLWRQGSRRPLVLVSQDAHDRSLAATFSVTWEKLSGERPNVQTFANSQVIKRLIQSSPKKDADNELIPIDQLFTPLEKKKQQSEEAVNQPIDAVYVLTSFSDLVLLKAFLEKQSGDRKPPLRIVAREPMLSLRADRRWALELERMAFNTLPLLQSPSSGKAWKIIRKHYKAQDEFSMRLFLMGMDAYVLALHLQHLSERPEKKLFGVTGTLILNSHRRVYRNNLAWIQFYNGKERAVL